MKGGKGVTCIDVGTASIKIASGVWAAEGVRLDQVHRVEFQPGTYAKYGMELQLDTLTDALSKVKVKGELLVTWSDPQNPYTVLMLPEMPESERLEAITWELTQRKKMDISKQGFDYLYIDQSFDQTGAKRTALVTSRPSEDIQKIVDCFQKKGLTLHALETPNGALVYGMQKLGLFPSKRAYLILNLGASCTYMLVVNENQLVFERKIATGGEALTKAIAEYCKLDYENAEKIKQEYGIHTQVMSDKIIEATHIQTSALEKLVSDIQYSIKYFTFQVTRSKVNKFERVWLTGGTALLPGLRDFIAERLAMDCTVISLGEQVKAPKVSGAEEPSWPQLATVIGLGYWDAAMSHTACTNLLPESARPKTFQEATSAQIKQGMGSLAVISAVLVGAILIGALSLFRLEAEISRRDKEVRRKELVLANLADNVEIFKRSFIELTESKEELARQNQEIRSKIFAIEAYSMKSHSPAQVMEQTAAQIPEGLFLTRLVLDEQGLRLAGLAPDNQRIAAFMKGVNRIDGFSRCRFLYTRKRETKDAAAWIEFEILAERV